MDEDVSWLLTVFAVAMIVVDVDGDTAPLTDDYHSSSARGIMVAMNERFGSGLTLNTFDPLRCFTILCLLGDCAFLCALFLPLQSVVAVLAISIIEDHH